MVESKVTISNVTPKKLKLADFDMGQTLGTGILQPKKRFFRASKNL